MFNELTDTGFYNLSVTGPDEELSVIEQDLERHSYDDSHGKRRVDARYLSGTSKTKTTFKIEPKDGYTLRIFGEFRRHPPNDVILKISQRYPSCIFTTEVNFDCGGESMVYEFTSGNERLVSRRQQGWFTLCDPHTQPVVHWDIRLRFDDNAEEKRVMEHLFRAGMIFSEFVDRNSVTDVLTWIEQHHPKVKVQDAGSMAFTLDEHRYFSDLCEWIIYENQDHVDHPFMISTMHDQKFRIIEREFGLTDQELECLILELTQRIPNAGMGEIEFLSVFSRIERIRNHFGRDRFDSRFLSRIEEQMTSCESIHPAYGVKREPVSGKVIFDNWFLRQSAEDSARRGYGRKFEPTAAELGLLLRTMPELASNRQREFEDALANPRWTTEWPTSNSEGALQNTKERNNG